MDMYRDYRNTGIVALSALSLTFLVLMFVAYNPWMLFGLAAVLWAIASIVRAINTTSSPGRAGQRHLPQRRQPDTNGTEITENPHDEPDPEADDDTASPPEAAE